jgi:polysaccharide deacetylase family protein (PEP-CTERM system associated)
LRLFAAKIVEDMAPDALQTGKRHLLTVLLEDYFHVGAFNRLIQQRQWYRFERRFEQNTRKALDLLDKYNVRATFFVLGWIADQQPEIVREVAARGHEIASRGYYPRSIRQLTPEEFRDDLARAREALQRASGQRIVGYRAAQKMFAPEDFWALDVLAEEGYAYDSSLMPHLRAAQQDNARRFAFVHEAGAHKIWEFPYSSVRIGPLVVPIAGGNYFRQLPHTFIKHAVARWHQRSNAPFVLYFHVWELDPEQPRLNVSPLTRLRHYRKLDKMRWVLEDYLNRYKFVGGADYLGMADCRLPNADLPEAVAAPPISLPVVVSSPPSAIRHPPSVSIVIPCYNEEKSLPYLANTLRSVEEQLSADYTLQFIFVDDCSRDRTPELLQEIFGARANCAILRHEKNSGVAAAILTGLRAAQTEIVCSMDCDCTYDPHELAHMIPLLTDDAAMVTASPYHPDGAVRNVPGWRLSLSRGASWLYRHILRQPLYTYTSCFRVYRRSVAQNVELQEKGFLGVAEMLGKLDLSGARIVEYPATLEVRLFGESKMKIGRTIVGHLKLMSRLLRFRLRGGATLAASSEVKELASVDRSLP